MFNSNYILSKIITSSEEFLISNAIKNHWKPATFHRTDEEIRNYFSIFYKTPLENFKSQTILNFIKYNLLILENRKVSIFRFKSPFKPLEPFNISYSQTDSLHKSWIHFFPSSKRTKNAIIYLHGWGKSSFFVEKRWHFPLIQKIPKGADIFAIELPYHMHRNPDKSQLFSGQGFLDSDPIRIIEAFRQSVIETNILYNSLLKSNYYSHIGVIGISLGGHIATLFNLIQQQKISKKPNPFILAALVGSPFYKNLQNLKISPNLIHVLNNKSTMQLFEKLDFIKISTKKPNPNFHLFGGKYDQLIPAHSVKRLGKHLNCPTYIFPTGHFTWSILLARALKLIQKSL